MRKNLIPQMTGRKLKEGTEDREQELGHAGLLSRFREFHITFQKLNLEEGY